MRIGIDCRTVLSSETGELAGTAQYTTALVRNLLEIDKNNTYVLFFDARAHVETYRRVNVEIVTLPPTHIPLAMTHVRLARALTRAKLDLFHSPAHPLPMFYRGRMVWTVHDCAIYDHPEWFPGSIRQWFSTRVTVPRGMRRSVKLIAPSKSTKRDIMRLFNAPEEKVRVVYEGASQEKLQIIPPQAGPRPLAVANHKFQILNSKYFLFIGTIEPRKNLVRLINAFSHFEARRLSKYTLMLAGGKGWKNVDVFHAIKKANDTLGRDAVRYLGYVSEEEKVALLQHATAFVWPSLYEGFGIPVLEAMAAGVPVITSHAGSIPEVVEDAAIMVGPMNEEAIAGAMERMASDAALREEFKKRGVIRAQQFSWEKAAQETLAVYQEVLSAQNAHKAIESART